MSTFGKLAWLQARVEMRHCLKAVADVERTQREVLLRLVGRHADSLYGRRYGFASIRSPRQFAQQVPLVAYADIAPDIDRARRQPRVLTCEPVAQWVYTSGSVTEPKLLPHTETSIREWCRGYARTLYAYMTTPAVADRIFSGKAVYDVAPARIHDIGGVPAGYISGVASQRNRRLRHYQSIPDSITRLPRHEEKLAALMKWSVSRNITCASGITSFTYRLLRYILDNAASLRDDPAYAAALEAASDGRSPVDLHRLWPGFELIASTGVPVDLYRPLLKEVAPRAAVRDTYNASEAAYGFSVDEEVGVILNSDLYYFELAEQEGTDTSVPLNEGAVGEPYELILTASNGLWRYRSGDVVRLLALDPPRVQILGRSGNTVNLSGEKLVEQQVTAALLSASKSAGVACSGYLFFGWIAHNTFTYCLAVEPDRPIEPLEDFARRFTECLERESYLFGLLRPRARTAMHLACLRKDTMSQLIQAAESRRGTAGHVKLRRLITLREFCSLVPPERISAQTLDPGLHEAERLIGRGGVSVKAKR